MKNRWILWMTAIVLMLTIGAAASATETQTRVYDYSELFSDAELTELETGIVQFQDDTGYDFAIVVTDGIEGYEDYQGLTDAICLGMGLGMGLAETCVVCVLDTSSDGYYYISVYGELQYLMIEDDLYFLVNNAIEYFNTGDVVGGLLWTMEITTDAVTKLATNDSTRVYDYAEMLSDEEIEELEAAIAEFRDVSGMDFVYLSTYDDMEGNDNGEYLHSFYETHGFGSSEDSSGAIIYVDLNNSYYYIQNFGNIDKYVSQSSLDEILSASSMLMSETSFGEAMIYIVETYTEYFEE